MSFNLQCEKTRQAILDVINNSGLPVAPIYYMLGNIYEEVEKTYYATLNQESAEQEKTPVEATADGIDS